MNSALKPLFEKLIDEDTDVTFEKNPKHFSSLAELQNSILEDLSRLLNTRLSVFWRDFSEKNYATPFSYGINITSEISSENSANMQQLETRIDKIIRQFEPRLIDAKSHFQGIGSDPSFISVKIDATVMFENKRAPLTFPVVITS
jgi:type VI secretion system lysozyme-like protein